MADNVVGTPATTPPTVAAPNGATTDGAAVAAVDVSALAQQLSPAQIQQLMQARRADVESSDFFQSVTGRKAYDIAAQQVAGVKQQLANENFQRQWAAMTPEQRGVVADQIMKQSSERNAVVESVGAEVNNRVQEELIAEAPIEYQAALRQAIGTGQIKSYKHLHQVVAQCWAEPEVKRRTEAEVKKALAAQQEQAENETDLSNGEAKAKRMKAAAKPDMAVGGAYKENWATMPVDDFEKRLAGLKKQAQRNGRG